MDRDLFHFFGMIDHGFKGGFTKAFDISKVLDPFERTTFFQIGKLHGADTGEVFKVLQLPFIEEA